MVLFQIRHRLNYSYDRPVFLEPMTVRLRPRQDAGQRLLNHSLSVHEAADGCCPIVDASGSDAVILWFNQKREHLALDVEMAVETLRQNPFDWIITDPSAQRLPLRYTELDSSALGPACAGAIDPEVVAWSDRIAADVEYSTTDFPLHLADRIHHDFQHVGRLEGDPLSPVQTLDSRRGACRDTALLFMAACRSQGLAARFVSGYSMHHPPEVSEHELHAWAEVYLPGGGWRGYDPSLGLAVADGHVVLASAHEPRLAAPVSGHFRGNGVGSSMSYRVEVRAAPMAPGPGEP